MSVTIELFAGEISLGIIEADIVDASMGVIGGILKPTAVYYADYQRFLQAHAENPDWEGLKALRLKAVTPLTGQLIAVGYDITDMMDQFSFETVDVNVVGITHLQMTKLFPNS